MDRKEITQTATAALQAGWLDTVDQLCTLGLQVHPGDVDLLLLAGHSASRRGDHAKAVERYSDALQASGGSLRVAGHLAPALHDHGDDAGALALARRMAAALPPDDWETRQNLVQFVLTSLHDEHAAAQIALLDETHRALMPMRLRIETASACNLRCQHCPTGVHYDATERGVMKHDLFERVLEQMKSLPSLRECVLYLGGEPLMNRHLVRMCRRVKAETSVLRTFITTNGMLLDEKNCAALATAQLDQIFVSVDGRSPEENDALRVRSRYRTIVENVARLRRHLEGTQTRIVISHAMIRRESDADEAPTPEFLTRDFPGLYVWSDYATRWPGFDLARTQIESATLTRREHANFCGFPFAEMAVRVTGDVVLCCHDLLGESVMGNIRETSLAQIWNGPAYRELRRQMLARNPEGVHPVCQRCYIFTGERIEQSPLTSAKLAAA